MWHIQLPLCLYCIVMWFYQPLLNNNGKSTHVEYTHLSIAVFGILHKSLALIFMYSRNKSKIVKLITVQICNYIEFENMYCCLSLNINHTEKCFKLKLQTLERSVFHVIDYFTYDEPLLRKII
jgi:hypothetical protein